MNRRLTIWLIAAVFVGLCASLPSVGAAGDVLVIANKDVPLSSLSQNDVKAIFLGKKTRWENEQKINFVLSEVDTTHQDFIQTFIRRTPSQYSRYWKKLVFTGKGRKPKSIKTDQGVVSYVASTSGAIGYISTEAVSSDVKVLSITAN
jgi:ABC-type phosphate transport system substrate-binding protein